MARALREEREAQEEGRALTFDTARVHELYNEGLCLQAHAVAREHGPLEELEGTAERLIAGRLARNLGADRLGARLHVRAHRDDPADPEALYYFARTVLERRGPLAAWRLAQKTPDLEGASPTVRSDWLAFQASVAALLRDFDAAEHWLGRAESVAPERPWIWIERSHIFELEDRYEDALRAARRSLELRPWFRPGVQAVGHLLELLGRDEEALALLRDASQRMESAPVAAQLSLLETELRRHADARASLDRFEALAPLLEESGRSWLDARRSDNACELGELERAIELAERSKSGFHLKVAERLRAAAPTAKRVLLDVAFVRQHHMTCSPATLSAVSRFWSMPAEHLEVAEKICYDGTPGHSERLWAEQRGWISREFTVTWESAKALLDRGVPFTLVTAEPASAHMQAIIGYDERRGTLLVRDPYLRNLGELAIEAALERYKATGPRGLALVPREKAALLDGLSLPDAELYDDAYSVQRALEEHDRRKAGALHARMAERAPAHRLTHQTRRALAVYDADPAAILAANEALLALFPGDPGLELSRVSCLGELVRRPERLATLKRLAEAERAAPIFYQLYADELATDARQHDEARWWLRRAQRRSPLDARNLGGLANILWDATRLADALVLYRFAACLDDKHEGRATAYFIAARHLKQTSAALLFLENRFERFGAKSAAPTETLRAAYSVLGREADALAVLDRALARRPEDGALLLDAALANARAAKVERAQALLEKARGRCPQTAWLRAAAAIASYRGDRAVARQLWEDVLAKEPLALDAHREVARLLAQMQSRAAAIEHLRAATARFPHSYGLHELSIEWLASEDDPSAHEAAVRALLETDPIDAWARRELAVCLLRQRRLDEALAAAEEGLALDPRSPSSHGVRAEILLARGDRDGARAGYRSAIAAFVDSGFPIRMLVAASDTLEEKREALAFVRAELLRQTTFGDGVIAYFIEARAAIAPEELVKHARELVAARGDLWHAQSVLVVQLLHAGLTADARVEATKATERWPLNPQVWRDRALVAQASGDRAAETDALRRALELRPEDARAVGQLVEVHERYGEFDQARKLLEQAVGRMPLEPTLHDMLAAVLWREGDKKGAVARIEHALRLTPDYDDAWRSLDAWSRELGEPDRALRLAREGVERRPGDRGAWAVLAKILDDPSQVEESLAALARAEALSPRDLEVHDLRTIRLATAGRFEEALAAATPAVFKDGVPGILRGRAAWVEEKRGDLPRAIALIRAAVAEDPNYMWGWARLAEWCRDSGDTKGYLEGAKGLVHCGPQNPSSLAMLGDALLRAGDRGGAKATLERVLELEPGTLQGSLLLLDLQLEDREFEKAERTLALAEPHLRDEWKLARRAMLAIAKGEYDAALVVLDKLPSATEGWRRAAGVYLEKLTRTNEVGRLRKFVAAHEATLRAHTTSWGDVAWSYSTLAWHKDCVLWASDWATREGLAPWMLTNVNISLRALGRDDEAARVCSRALDLPPDHATPIVARWSALDRALVGDAASALRLADEADAATLEPYTRFVHDLARAVASAIQGDQVNARVGVAAALVRYPAWGQSGPLKVLHRRAVRKIGAVGGTVFSRVWGVWAWLTKV